MESNGFPKCLFLVLLFIKCKFHVALKAFEHHLMYIKQASLSRYGPASEDGDGCLSVVVVVLIVLFNQLHIY